MAETSTSFITIYNAAVTLNNISISLMERRSYSAAMTILHDALDILRSAVATADWRLYSRLVFPAEIEHKVYFARLYLSSESEEDPPLLIPCMRNEDESDNQDDSSSMSDFREEDDDIFCILSQYGQNMNLSDVSLLPSTRKKYIFYIQERISTVQEDISEEDEIETQITLALLLHNYGQVCRYVASIYHGDRKARADGLLEGANNFFHLSRSLLQDLPCPVPPVLSVAIHQTKLGIECDLGLSLSAPDIEAFSSSKNSKKCQHLISPTSVVKSFEGSTTSFASFDESNIVEERVIRDNTKAA
jgi:hypothetical protein